MKKNNDLLILIEKIEKTQNIIEEIYTFYENIKSNELKILGKKQSTALIIAQILENYYTCLETLFLRISQFFENNISQDKWHTELLNNMLLKIEGIRIPVLSEKTYKNLVEIMRFRHFKRYYFELDYDWVKLDYLSIIFEESNEFVDKDLKNFKSFLRLLLKNSSPTH